MDAVNKKWGHGSNFWKWEGTQRSWSNHTVFIDCVSWLYTNTLRALLAHTYQTHFFNWFIFILFFSMIPQPNRDIYVTFDSIILSSPCSLSLSLQASTLTLPFLSLSLSLSLSVCEKRLFLSVGCAIWVSEKHWGLTLLQIWDLRSFLFWNWVWALSGFFSVSWLVSGLNVEWLFL
jgi:hypothetical protein